MLGSCERHVCVVKSLPRVESSILLLCYWITCLMLRRYGLIHQRYCFNQHDHMRVLDAHATSWAFGIEKDHCMDKATSLSTWIGRTEKKRW